MGVFPPRSQKNDAIRKYISTKGQGHEDRMGKLFVIIKKDMKTQRNLIIL